MPCDRMDGANLISVRKGVSDRYSPASSMNRVNSLNTPFLISIQFLIMLHDCHCSIFTDRRFPMKDARLINNIFKDGIFYLLPIH